MKRLPAGTTGVTRESNRLFMRRARSSHGWKLWARCLKLSPSAPGNRPGIKINLHQRYRDTYNAKVSMHSRDEKLPALEINVIV